MSATADGDEQTTRGVGLLLPSSWWTIRLADEVARRASIARLVEQQVGRSDQKATLRAELRRDLERTAEQAAASGGVLLAISTMTIDGLPVPASLTVYRVGRHAPSEADAHELADLLASQTSEPEGSSAQAQVEVLPGVHGPVVRRLRLGGGDADLDAQDVAQLVVDYWLDAGDGTLTNLTFSSPLVALAPVLLDLFDAVVDTLAVEAD